jgi:hypothetical protein
MAADRIGFLAFARLVIDALEAADIEYLIGGAVAAWAWGEPRTTQDFDLVIHLPGNRIRLLSEELAKRDMLVPPEIILDILLQTEGDLPINAIHLHSNRKAELFLLRPEDASRQLALQRRRLVNLGAPLDAVYVHAPDDLILHKLRYYALSGQTKHVRDIAGILTTSRDEIDWDYLHHWIERFGLTEVWSALQAEIDRLSD